MFQGTKNKNPKKCASLSEQNPQVETEPVEALWDFIAISPDERGRIPNNEFVIFTHIIPGCGPWTRACPHRRRGHTLEVSTKPKTTSGLCPNLAPVRGPRR